MTRQRGFKNTFYEGGTLSSTFVYFTKRTFPSKLIKNIVHITDWMPTILDFAGYRSRVGFGGKPLDGVSQSVLFQKPEAEILTPPRTSFIYGVAHEWDEQENNWKLHYAVRFENWKYMNFRRELYGLWFEY